MGNNLEALKKLEESVKEQHIPSAFAKHLFYDYYFNNLNEGINKDNINLIIEKAENYIYSKMSEKNFSDNQKRYALVSIKDHLHLLSRVINE